jgi:hypothetical protein
MKIIISTFITNDSNIGLLFGILMKLPALDSKEVNPIDEHTHGIAEPTLPNVGIRYT